MNEVISRPAPRAVRISSALFAGSAALAALMLLTTAIAWDHFGPASEVYAAMVEHPENPLGEVRGYLRLTTGIAVLVIVLAGPLALGVRRPHRWIQVAAWAATAVLAYLLFTVLMASLQVGLGNPDPGSDRALYNALLPSWWPGLTAVAGLILELAVLAAGVALLHSPVLDFYRRASNVADDPRRVAFMQRQLSRQDNREPPPQGR
ncbi:hypothetical protein ACQP2X_20145 [Actinoplanes sp. CA-131856]